MESFIGYLGIGVAAVVGIVLIVWLIFFVRIFFGTKGLPQAITNFFELIATGEIDNAYQLTTENFRTQVSKKQFLKFLKTNKFKQYQRLKMAMPSIKGKDCTIGITLITKSGIEIPLKMGLMRKGKDWQIDVLENS
ncbi:MAG: hypothetical protein F6K21_19285 [Symploca sp. SIO2D2]|nr:hypothetical protein [Symploca sp. SIO2D2]NER22163.1 hypothetical protein [Symploca sp. SIO1C2]